MHVGIWRTGKIRLVRFSLSVKMCNARLVLGPLGSIHSMYLACLVTPPFMSSVLNVISMRCSS